VGQAGSMRHAASCLLACGHAALARLCADPTVLMHLGVLLTFLGTEATGGGAGVQHSSDHFFVRPGPTGGNSACDVADVGAVQVQPDALRQRLDVVLRKAGIGTGRAGLRAGVALLYATDERIIGLSAHMRVRSDHVLCVHWNLHDCGNGLPPLPIVG
jgi:hypothetical protein